MRGQAPANPQELRRRQLRNKRKKKSFKNKLLTESGSCDMLSAELFAPTMSATAVPEEQNQDAKRKAERQKKSKSGEKTETTMDVPKTPTNDDKVKLPEPEIAKDQAGKEEMEKPIEPSKSVKKPVKTRRKKTKTEKKSRTENVKNEKGGKTRNKDRNSTEEKEKPTQDAEEDDIKTARQDSEIASKAKVSANVSTTSSEDASTGQQNAASLEKSVLPKDQENLTVMQMKMRRIKQLITDLNNVKLKHTKIKADTDAWRLKYEKRLIDLDVSMTKKDKQIKKYISRILDNLATLEQTSIRNHEKRVYIKKLLERQLPATNAQKFSMKVTIIFVNILHTVLYYIAVMRDFLFYKKVDRTPPSSSSETKLK